MVKMQSANNSKQMKMLKATLVLILILFSLVLTTQFTRIEFAQLVYGQGPTPVQNETDLKLNSSDIKLSESSPYAGENQTVTVTVNNTGNLDANAIVNFYIYEKNSETPYKTLIGTNAVSISANGNAETAIDWHVDAPPGDYELRVCAENTSTYDPDQFNNEAAIDFEIRSALKLTVPEIKVEPGAIINLTLTIYNNLAVSVDTTVNFYYETLALLNLTNSTNLVLRPLDTTSVSIDFVIDRNSTIYVNYSIWVEVITSSDPGLYVFNKISSLTLTIVPSPDTTEENVITQLWFIIGLIALILFFVTIIASLVGLIPQDRLPIQPALLVMAFVITVVALIGHAISPRIHLIGPQDLAGMIIIHPITALTAGFLVAGALEASGAFTAAIDGLSRLEKLSIKGHTIFGITGTVVILTNLPTIIAMPCGRILAAALMPAALFFGYRVAKSLGDARMVGVVVFAFIVNAAASCGPSPLGGIGTIGEGMAGLPIGSFTTAQSTGIMMATGVCAVIMRFITPLRPSDLSDEDIQREQPKTDIEQMIEENRKKSEALVAKPVVAQPVQPPPQSPPGQPPPSPPETDSKGGNE